MTNEEKKQLIDLLVSAAQEKINEKVDSVFNGFNDTYLHFIYPIAEKIFKDICEAFITEAPDSDIIYRQHAILKQTEQILTQIHNEYQRDRRNMQIDPIELRYNGKTFLAIHR